MHVIWGAEFGSDEIKGHLFGPDGKLKAFPTVKSLAKLDREIQRLVSAWGAANHGGFIQSAMPKSKK